MHLPDLLQLGPFRLPIAALGAIGAILLWGWLAPRLAACLSPGTSEVPAPQPDRTTPVAAFAERLALNGGLGLLIGAKLLASLPALPSILANPLLLLNLPAGNWAWAGAALGLCTGLGLTLLRQRNRLQLAALATQLHPALDALALAALPAAALYAASLPDDRAWPAALALLAGGSALWLGRRHARYPGHLSLAALVVLGCIAVLVDLLLPGRTGLTGPQIAGLSTAAAAYLLAHVRQRTYRSATSEPDAVQGGDP